MDTTSGFLWQFIHKIIWQVTVKRLQALSKGHDWEPPNVLMSMCKWCDFFFFLWSQNHKILTQMHVSGEAVSSTKRLTHEGLRHSQIISSSQLTCVLSYCGSSSLWAFTKAFSEVLRTGSEIYCAERYDAKWALHLKDNHRSKASLLLCQERKSLCACQYVSSAGSLFSDVVRIYPSQSE